MTRGDFAALVPPSIAIDRIDPSSRRDVQRFVDLPYRLHAGRPHWVPPLRSDEALRLDRRRHPFYDHSEAEFFVAVRDGHVVGRVAALENRPFNAHHAKREAHFSLLEIEDGTARPGRWRARSWGKWRPGRRPTAWTRSPARWGSAPSRATASWSRASSIAN